MADQPAAKGQQKAAKGLRITAPLERVAGGGERCWDAVTGEPVDELARDLANP